jgi:transcriptional regulator with XRE-family HTH domain
MPDINSNTGDPRILFGERLIELRKAKGWSQERLSLESGVTRSYLGGVERGQRNIALVNICRLAEALSVSPSVLLRFESKSLDLINSSKSTVL